MPVDQVTLAQEQFFQDFLEALDGVGVFGGGGVGMVVGFHLGFGGFRNGRDTLLLVFELAVPSFYRAFHPLSE